MRGMPYTNNLDTLGPSDVRFVDMDKRSNYSETDTEAEQFIRNKPTIPDAQVQADWNQAAATAKDYIKNKPTIPALPSAPAKGESDAMYVLKVSSGGSVTWEAYTPASQE